MVIYINQHLNTENKLPLDVKTPTDQFNAPSLGMESSTDEFKDLHKAFRSDKAFNL